jgi:predicted transcriptional regulator
VLARIIKALRDNGPTNRTALATSAGVSYDRLVLYLRWMTEKNFVSLDDDSNVRLTPQGAKAYDELVTWIIEHVGQLKLSRSRFSQDS